MANHAQHTGHQQQQLDAELAAQRGTQQHTSSKPSNKPRTAYEGQTMHSTRVINKRGQGAEAHESYTMHNTRVVNHVQHMTNQPCTTHGESTTPGTQHTRTITQSTCRSAARAPRRWRLIINHAQHTSNKPQSTCRSAARAPRRWRPIINHAQHTSNKPQSTCRSAARALRRWRPTRSSAAASPSSRAPSRGPI